MRRASELVGALCVLVWLGGCLSSEEYRERAGIELCTWVYDCHMGGVSAPLENTYGFDDEEECREWFFEDGHWDFDGEWVVASAEEDDTCDFDRHAGGDYLDLLGGLSCDELDVRSFVELAEDTFGQAYADCWARGGGS